jgi:asparagine synthase (glutamine-hydrolysing)
MVSGGLDSSSVFCMAETLRRATPGAVPPIFGVTLTYPQASPADESEFIAAIERQYGVSILKAPVKIVSDGFVSSLQKGTWHVEFPVLDAQWDELQVFYQAASDVGARVVLTGHWGDLVTAESSHLVDLFNRFQFAALWARLREFPRWTTDFPPGHHPRQFLQDLLRYQKRWLPETVVRLLRRLRARHHLPAPYSRRLRRSAREAEWRKLQSTFTPSSFHAQSLCTRMESRYFLTCTEEQNKVSAMHQMEFALPLADRDVLCFVIAAPPEAYSAGAVPRGMLRQALRGVLPDGIAGRRDKGNFLPYINAVMSSQLASIVGLVQGESKVLQRGYVDRDSIGRELQRWKEEIQIQGSTGEAAGKLQRLCRLELWLQTYFDDTEKNCPEVTSCAKQSVMLPTASQ